MSEIKMSPSREEWQALMGWHLDQKMDAAFHEDYLKAANHKARRDAIEKMLTQDKLPYPTTLTV